MHRRQHLRKLTATAIAGVAANVEEEIGLRPQLDLMPMVSVRARVETIDAGAGTIGEPVDERDLQIEFQVWATGNTGALAVDGINDLDESIGVALGVATDPGGILFEQASDYRWQGTTIETTTDEHDRIWAFGSIIYVASYHVWFGDPT